MTTTHLSQMVQQLRKAVLLQDGAGLTDGQLLGCFIEHRDEAAFATLVKRHGPMVWGVCRRLLRNHHDAEDAFQATFLVLVRKAACIVPREMVGNWLYGVAHKTGLKARATAARRRRKETQVMAMPEPAVEEQDLWQDLQPLLDQELSRLHDKYRTVLVLSDLEGKTRKEVARQLGLPEGTVGSRLARARAMLAKRLARYGLPIFGGTLATLVAQNGAPADVPASVMLSTIKAVGLDTGGQAAAGLISIKVAALTEGVLKTMLLTKLKTKLVALLLLAAVCGGLSLLNYGIHAADPVEARRHTKERPGQTSDDLAGLRKARLAAALKAFDKVWDQYQWGLTDEEQVYRWSVRLLEAERDVAANRAQRVAAFVGHFNRMKELENTAPDRPIARSRPDSGHEDPGVVVRFEWAALPSGKVLPYAGPTEGKVIPQVGSKSILRSDIAVLTAFYRAEAEVWLAETVQ